MKNSILVILFLGLGFNAIAQDDAITSQYLVNPYFVNPAAAGFNGMQNFHAGIRTGMVSLPQRPTTYYASYNGALGKSVGLGAMLLNDKVGSINKYRMQMSYAFNWMAGSKTKLSMGLNAEFHQFNIDNGVQTNVFTEGGDLLLAEAINGNQYFDATLGLFGEYNNRLQFGLTLPNLVRARLNEGTDEELNPFETAARHFTAFAGYKLRSKEYDVTVEPSIMIRKGFSAPLISDFNLRTYFLKDRVSLGGMVRVIDSETIIGVLAGIKFGSLRLNYFYDVSFQRTQRYHGGSHELTLNIEMLGKKKETAPAEGADPMMPAK